MSATVNNPAYDARNDASSRVSDDLTKTEALESNSFGSAAKASVRTCILPPSVEDRIHLRGLDRQNRVIVEAAQEVQRAIPAWLPEHAITHMSGRLLVEIDDHGILSETDRADLKQRFLAACTVPLDLKIGPLSSVITSGTARLSNRKTPLANPATTEAIRRDIERSVPSRAALIKVAFSESISEHGLDLVIVRLQSRPADRQRIEAWRDKLEQKYRIGIQLQQDTLNYDVQQQLRPSADADGVIRDISKLPGFVEFVHGISRPELTAEDLQPLPQPPAADLTKLPFFAIDNPPRPKDPEDVIYHEQLPNGNSLIMVGIPLFMRIAPNNKHEKAAMTMGESIYGRRTSIPLFDERYTYGEAAFVEGENRIAILASAEVDPLGKILKDDLCVAKIRNHRQLTYPEANRLLRSGKADEMGARLRSLSELAGRLQQRGLPGTGFVGRGSSPGAEGIVSQCSIIAKHILGRAFERYNLQTSEPIPFFSRAYVNPSEDMQKRFLEQIRAAGVDADMRVFEDSALFREMLDSLRQNGAAGVAREIQDAHYKRGHFSTQNEGHDALQLSTVVPNKVRQYGWITHVQVRAMLLGERGYSAEELRKLVALANENQSLNDYKTFKLRLREDIEDCLARPRTDILARVVRVNSGGTVYVDVPGFERWGVLAPAEEKNCHPGQKIVVRLDGFDINRMRNRFRTESVTTSPTVIPRHKGARASRAQ